MASSDQLNAIVEFCASEARICPEPNAWHRFWLAVKNAAGRRRIGGFDFNMRMDHDRSTKSLNLEPPLPNILASWWGTSDVQKVETLKSQLLWAAQHGALDVADRFLRGLRADEWHRAEEPSTSSVIAFMEQEWRMSVEAKRIGQAENRQQRLAAAQAHRDRKAPIDRRYRSSLDQNLIRAYEATAYVVFAEPEFAMRIGQRSGPIFELFNRTGTNCAAYITAWNPKGEACDPVDNAAAQKRLAACVEELGLDSIKGEGRGEIGDWPPEESLLILGCKRNRAKRLGHRFKQNAVVWIGAGAVPELIMLVPFKKAQE
ncbi:hypothetical protein MACH24_04880 [Erythrobacter sp. Dej080120_24]|uniref:DUF3293 domain-containing protein n=1 Tax=Erythrobacter sp. Dej080120_24 TaxID=3024837 RepID=UPI0029248378|nr:hypothetical protein MACH24_04880 [Erythrobacter sp. Dej080120_24]